MQVFSYINVKWKWLAILHLLVYQTVAVPTTDHLLSGSKYRWAASEAYRQQCREKATGSLHAQQTSSDPVPDQSTSNSTSQSIPPFESTPYNQTFTHGFPVTLYVVPNDAPYDELSNGNMWRYANEPAYDRWTSQEFSKYNITIATVMITFNEDGSPQIIAKRGFKELGFRISNGWDRFGSWLNSMFTWKNSGKRLKRNPDIIVRQSEFRIIEREIVETVGGGAPARFRKTETELIYMKRGARRLADVVSDLRATTGEGPVPIERVPHHTGTSNTGAPNTGAPNTGAFPEGTSEIDSGYFADNEGSRETPIRSTQPEKQRIYEGKQEHERATHKHAKKSKQVQQKESSTQKSIKKNDEIVQQKAVEESTASEKAAKAETEDDGKRLREKAGKASTGKNQVQQETTELRKEEGMLQEARTDLKQEGEQLFDERGALNEAQKSLDSGDVERSKAKLEVAQDHGKKAARYADASTQTVEKVDSRQQSRRPFIAENTGDVDKGPTADEDTKKQEAERKKQDAERKTQEDEARKKQEDEARNAQDNEARKKQDDKARKNQDEAQRKAKEEAERNKPKPGDHPEGSPPSAEELAEAHRAVSRDAQLPHEIEGMQNMIAGDAANAEAARARLPDLQRQATELQAEHQRLQLEWNRAPDDVKMKTAGEKRAVQDRWRDITHKAAAEQEIVDHYSFWDKEHQKEFAGFRGEAARVKTELGKFNERTLRTVTDARMASALPLSTEIAAIEAEYVPNLQRARELYERLWNGIHPEAELLMTAANNGVMSPEQSQRFQALKAEEGRIIKESLGLAEGRIGIDARRADALARLNKVDPATHAKHVPNFVPADAPDGMFPKPSEATPPWTLSDFKPQQTKPGGGNLVEMVDGMMLITGESNHFDRLEVHKGSELQKHPNSPGSALDPAGGPPGGGRDPPTGKGKGKGKIPKVRTKPDNFWTNKQGASQELLDHLSDGTYDVDVARTQDQVKKRMRWDRGWNPERYSVKTFEANGRSYIKTGGGHIFQGAAKSPSSRAPNWIFRLVKGGLPAGAVEVPMAGVLGKVLTSQGFAAIRAIGMPAAKIAVGLVTGILVVVQVYSLVKDIQEGHYGKAALDAVLAAISFYSWQAGLLILAVQAVIWIGTAIAKKIREHHCHDALNDEYKAAFFKKCGHRPEHVPTRKKMWSVKAFQCHLNKKKDYERADLVHGKGWDRLPQMPEYAASHPIQHGKKPCQE
nr:hypothetical protein B0A51_09098 [Rachicladosporium sp. CCFEE 5018]